MVASLLKLRLLVLRNTLKRSTWQLVAVIIGGLYGLAMLVFVVIGLFALSFAPLEIAQAVIVFAGSAALLGWVIIPLLTTGIDQTLDIPKLAHFPIPRRELMVGLTLSGFIAVPGAATLISGIATAGTFWKHPLAALAAVACGAIGAVSCVVASRMIGALSASLASNRRFREVTGIILFVPLILLGPILSTIGTAFDGSTSAVLGFARTLSWTPVGAIWSVAGDIATGDTRAAATKFLIGLAVLGVLVLLWRRALGTALVSPPVAVSKVRMSGKLGLFGILPATPTFAVAARSLTYWLRDPRYAQQLLLVPLLPILLWFNATIVGNPQLVNLAPPFVAFLLATSTYSDVSYDNTAFAVHITTGVSGRADRAGRIIAISSFAIPIVVLLSIGSAFLSGAPEMAPAIVALSVGILVTGMAVSSITSARFVFPVPAPGDSPFKAKPGGNLSAIGTTFLTWWVLFVLTLPETVLAVVSVFTGDPLLGWLALTVAVALSGTLLMIGVRIGGRMLDRRAPELLEQLSVQK